MTPATRTIHLRALKVAVIVGTLLACINYGDKIYLASMSSTDWLKLAITYAVPYLVSLFSGLSALKAL